MRHFLCCAAVLCAAFHLAVAPASVRAQDSSPQAATAPLSGVVNVNQATPEQLRLLPGVGPARAQAIVEYRKTNGPFERVEDLTAVSGIGQRALERMRPYVVLAGKTTAQPTR